jgi:hypothetical protein
MSISSLFCPNDYKLYAAEFITDNPVNPGNVPAMSANAIPNALLVVGGAGTAIVSATCRTVAMPIIGQTASFSTNTIDFITLSAPNPANPAQQLVQITVHIPQFTITALSGTAASVFTIGTLAAPVVPLALRPSGLEEPVWAVIMQTNATGPVYTDIIVSVQSSGILQFNIPGASTTYANGSAITGDACFTYTLALS